ncbi:AraC family transcriptional regulator [Nocardia sp. NPDC004568]|uniref:AraC family transcriptional regulator n=1 Tax=Nocardia sp. NPDC004568 TaxID=3154551 RepID=UPI0033A9AB8A
MDELREKPEQPLHLPAPQDDRLQSLARTLAENPADNTSLTELGKAVGAGSRTPSRLLRNELGMTFSEWRTRLRIFHTFAPSPAGYDTTRTAYACGWSNSSLFIFIAAFTDIIGTTPGRYRAGRRGAERGS